jgi:hypothetical protein
MGFRLELVDVVFQLASNNFMNEARLYRTMVQSMGISGAPVSPMPDHRTGAARQIQTLEWMRVYDLICRWWADFPSELQEDYCRAVNIVLGGNGIAWDFRRDGTFGRVLPIVVQREVEIGFQELGEPRFEAARVSFLDAMKAYNAIPRRDRDACGNAFDALESVAKSVYNMPRATFGDVLSEMRRQQDAAAETISTLEKVYLMANKHFRHGMTTTFVLKRAEVDFVIGECLAGILLFTRL